MNIRHSVTKRLAKRANTRSTGILKSNKIINNYYMHTLHASKLHVQVYKKNVDLKNTTGQKLRTNQNNT